MTNDDTAKFAVSAKYEKKKIQVFIEHVKGHNGTTGNEFVDKLLENNRNLDFLAVLETNRGCPYKCAYCDWSAKSKVRFFPNISVFFFQAQDLIHVLALGSQHDDGNIGKFPDFAAGGQTVHFRHHHVQHHQIRMNLIQQLLHCRHRSLCILQIP